MKSLAIAVAVASLAVVGALFAIRISVVILGFVALAAISVPSELSAAPQASVQDARPWEKLPDGRFVIEIKGNRVALDPAILKGSDASVQFVPERTPGARALTFREVVQNPAFARGEFNRWARVVLRTWNGRTTSGRFLGKYHRQLLPTSFRIELIFWENPQEMMCESVTSIPGTAEDCRTFNELAKDASRIDGDGLIIARFPHGKPPRTIYIIPKTERASANDEAIYFSCTDVLPGCRNSALNFFGYAVRNNVSLFYDFSYTEYPKERMRDLDRRMTELFDDILLDR